MIYPQLNKRITEKENAQNRPETRQFQAVLGVSAFQEYRRITEVMKNAPDAQIFEGRMGILPE